MSRLRRFAPALPALALAVGLVPGAPPGASAAAVGVPGAPGEDVVALGGAPFLGSTSADVELDRPVVGIAAHPGADGYWEVTDDGRVAPFGAAGPHGDMAGTPLNAPVVGMAATPSGAGYWLVASDGGVFAFGDAGFHGSAGGLPLVAPIVAVTPTASGGGYWMAAADGGVFAYGDAGFHGSLGGLALVAPIVGAARPGGQAADGYWLAAADGGVFAFGEAVFAGSIGGLVLSEPVVGMAADPDGSGYWLAATDGGVFAFAVPFPGSVAGAELGDEQVVGIAARGAGEPGLWLVLGPVPDHDRPWWLGTRPLPEGAEDLGLPTPAELVVRRFAPPPSALGRPAGGAFVGTVADVPAEVVARSTWRPECPVGLTDLRYVTVSYWGFDDRAHTGEVLVHRTAAEALVGVFRRLFDARYPIEELRVLRMEELGTAPTGDDNISSAFECRAATGGTSWSEHASGLAIDINPFHNPYLRGSTVFPALSGAYLDRGRPVPGVIRAGDPVHRAFADIGWGWGGSWTSLKDWMHFSRSGH